MKPKTYQEMKDRYFENVVNAWPDDVPEDEVNIMTGENETMEWIAKAEGKNKDFKKWIERCNIEVDARDQGL